MTKIPHQLMDIEAVILAGGHSTRMGKPKALLDFRGQTFLQHLMKQLQMQTGRVSIIGEPTQGIYQPFADMFYADDQNNLGPLGGINTALALCRSAWVLVVPCDNPLLPSGFAHSLYTAAQQKRAPLVYVRKDGREQPLYALIRSDLQCHLHNFLQAGERKVLGWYSKIGALPLDYNKAGMFFENINTPVEYERFIRSTA